MHDDPWLNAITTYAVEVAVELSINRPALSVWELYEALWKYEDRIGEMILSRLPEFGHSSKDEVTFQRFRVAVVYYYVHSFLLVPEAPHA